MIQLASYPAKCYPRRNLLTKNDTKFSIRQSGSVLETVNKHDLWRMWFTSETGINFLLCGTIYYMSFQVLYADVNRTEFSWFTTPFSVTSQFRHFGIHCLYFQGDWILFRRMMNWLWDGSVGRLQKWMWSLFYMGFFHYISTSRFLIAKFFRCLKVYVQYYQSLINFQARHPRCIV
jgi:hypothetical protein